MNSLISKAKLSKRKSTFDQNLAGFEKHLTCIFLPESVNHGGEVAATLSSPQKEEKVFKQIMQELDLIARSRIGT
jgi:hypothetical protein